MQKEIKQIHGEDPSFGGDQLFIDLIPRKCWFSSIRTSLVKSDWDKLRAFVFKRANYTCQCCKSKENKLQGHQRWSYDYQKKIQKLMRIIALCQKCHLATHFGRAQCIGYADQAKQHLINVRKFNQIQFQNHRTQAFKLWKQRNNIDWQLDLTIIKQNGLRLTKKCSDKQKKTQELHLQSTI